MGIVSQAAYNLGVAFGLASYQASVGANPLASDALGPGGGQIAADTLAGAGLLPKIDIYAYVSNNVGNIPVDQRASTNVYYNTILAYREFFESEISRHGSTLGNVFQLGLDMGLAEGQCTTSDWGDASKYAAQALSDAAAIVTQDLAPSGVALDVQTLRQALTEVQDYLSYAAADIYSLVQRLRLEYAEQILRSKLP